MNYYLYTYKNKDGVEKELRLRLTSGNAIELENSKNVKLLDYLQDESMTSIITILRYMVRWENKNFSLQNAAELYDELIDSGLTMKKILIDIIYETLVVSGFLSKGEWEKIKPQTQPQENMTTLEII